MRKQTFEAGKICNTHGIRGEVKVLPWTDKAEDFERFGYVYVICGKEKKKLNINSVKYQKTNVILKLESIDTMDAAESLKGGILYIDRAQLGELEDGYYIADLIGIKAVSDEGEELGTIDDVIQTGANDVYVIKDKNGKSLLVPVIDECVLEVDIDKEICKIHLLEGLR